MKKKKRMIKVNLLAVSILSSILLVEAGNASTFDKDRVNEAKGKAAAWLETQQNRDGAWLPSEQPAVTAIVLAAYKGNLTGKNQSESADKGYSFLLKNLHPDGGVYGGTNYQNYNTSWSVIAFANSRRPEAKSFIQNARPLMVSWQMDLGEKGKVDSQFDGGIGYGDGTPRANLANTVVPLEALYITRNLAKKGEPKLNQEMLRSFLHRCQHLASVNPEPWVLKDGDNENGFIYNPGRSMAGEIKLPDNKVSYKAYGSMTLAGLLASFYADVKKDDPAVKAAWKWVNQHFTVEENPGLGKDGLYHYYYLLAKTCNLYKIKTITLPDGTRVDWRDTLAKKILSLQRPDGSWVNPDERWLENNPVLCTAYALTALNEIQGR